MTDLLLDAFDHDVRTRPVDEQHLTAGARGRLRRHRRVRRLQIAGAALVVTAAIPVTVQAWPAATVSTIPAHQTPTAAATPDTTSNTMTPSPVSPSGTASATSAPPSPDTVISSAMPTLTGALAALPTELTLLSDSGPYREELTPLTGLGLDCDMNSTAPRTTAAQEMHWVDEVPKTAAQEGVVLLVTQWQPGQAAQAFDSAANGSGACQFAFTREPLNLTIPGADQSWIARTDSIGPYQGASFTQISGIARVGNFIVGVSHQNATPDEADELSAVLAAAVADLRASGLPATQGQ